MELLINILSSVSRRYNKDALICYHHHVLFLLLICTCSSSSIFFCNGQQQQQVDTSSTNNNNIINIDVGVILDLDTYMGKMSKTSMEMAVEDFYASPDHTNYTTRLILHTRDSKSDDAVGAAAAAVHLLKDYQVRAILGPQKSGQVEFVAQMGVKSQVPIVSFTATGPLVSHLETPYFIRVAQPDTAQLRAIASITQQFNWRQLVPIYETTPFGSGIVSYLSDELKKVGTGVPYRCRILPSATDDQILKELYKLMTMQSRVFLVHMMPSLASRVFLLAKEAGMMTKGYAWIITYGITTSSLLMANNSLNIIDSMQGVIGLKPYIAETVELDQFSKRWKDRFVQEYPEMMMRLDNNNGRPGAGAGAGSGSGSGSGGVQLNAFGLWAYDSVSLLAQAVEACINNIISSEEEFKRRLADVKSNNNSNSLLTDIESIGVFKSGPELLRLIQTTRFKGISGEINLKVDGELPISPFRIINVVGSESREIGIWTPPSSDDDDDQKINNNGNKIIWPGKSNVIPRGWEISVNNKKLRVGVPVKSGFGEFISVTRDNSTNAIIVKGYCKDVFAAVMAALPFNVPYEYDQPDDSGSSDGSYDNIVDDIYSKKYDVAVGDITIRESRSMYADFTLPYTESGVSMIVPVKGDDRRNAWIFTKPLTMELWITIGAFFLYTGFVIWVLEHRWNKQLRKPGIIMWFSFSTLVFAYTEKVVSNLTRFVLIIWVFVVFVLTSSYTASLTSFLTVQQLQPTVTDINDIIRSGGVIGYQRGSFVPGLLKSLGVDASKLQELKTPEDYNEKLSSGAVAAIVDELPYLRVVLGKYCSKFRMVGPTYKTAGFGFAFPRGSPLVPEVSRAILKVMESPKMADITNYWFPNSYSADGYDCGSITSSDSSLRLDSFKGLFLIAIISSTLALLIFLMKFLYEIRNTLTSPDFTVKQKLVVIAKTFYNYAPKELELDVNTSTSTKEDEEEEDKSKTSSSIEMVDFNNAPQGFIYDLDDASGGFSPGAISLMQHEEGMFSADDSGLHSAESPGSPYHSYAVVRATDQDRPN